MLKLIPVSLPDANAFVAEHHRHHKPVRGHKFSLGCEKDGQLVGVAIVGRPVSRYLDDGKTLEVNRLCATGEKNVCSFLYGAAARAAKALGFQAFLIIVCVAIYAVLVQNIASMEDISAAIWTCMGYTVLLCFCLFKTGSLAKSLRYEKALTKEVSTA